MFNYNEMDEIVPLERCLEIIETDKKGERTFHREKNKKIVCTVGDHEFTVKYNLAIPMQSLWDAYTCLFEPEDEPEPDELDDDEYLDDEDELDDDEPVYYDPCDVMRKVTGSLTGINTEAGVFEYTLSEHFPEDAAQLTKEQAQKRYLWFARACGLCGTNERLQRIAELFPKKKDGSLHKRRVLRIATLFYCDRFGELKQLVAKDTGESEISVSLRDANLLPEELDAIFSDVASTTDLFDFQ